MFGGAEEDYLRSVQYRDETNLSARIALHQRFSTNGYGWPRWIFDQFRLPDDAAILELGCGPGSLWRENRARVPAGWRVTLTDFSPGMIAAARQGLADMAGRVTFLVADAQAIPFAPDTFDAVLANHMLYHVPDRSRAFAEIRRVLRPSGQFFAATNGEGHLAELDALIETHVPGPGPRESVTRFSLENGAAQLRPWFDVVERRDYPDHLEVTDVEPLIAYIHSTAAAPHLDEPRLTALRQTIAATIARDGAFRISKAAGLFIGGPTTAN